MHLPGNWIVSFDIARERRLKARSMIEPWNGHCAFLQKLSAFGLSGAPGSKIDEAFQILKTAAFGAGKEDYIAHPVRVAEFCLDFSSQPDESLVMTALLHNIMEVAGFSSNRLQSLFGKKLFNAWLLLAVDRALQEDPVYLNSYYQRLRDASPDVRLVKIMDKLDNLLILFKQPSIQIKTRYLNEIEQHLLSLVRMQTPDLEPVFLRLIEENRTRPHQTLEEYLRQSKD